MLSSYIWQPSKKSSQSLNDSKRRQLTCSKLKLSLVTTHSRQPRTNTSTTTQVLYQPTLCQQEPAKLIILHTTPKAQGYQVQPHCSNTGLARCKLSRCPQFRQKVQSLILIGCNRNERSWWPLDATRLQILLSRRWIGRSSQFSWSWILCKGFDTEAPDNNRFYRIVR